MRIGGLTFSILVIILVISAFVHGHGLPEALGIGLLVNVIIYIIWAYFTMRDKEHKDK